MSASDAPERRRGDRRHADEQRFWRALKGERRRGERRREPPPALGPPGEPPSGSTASERADAAASAADDARRETLRQLLRAAEARQGRSSRARRPTLARGSRVRVLRGEPAGRLGTVADADYIHNRALVALDGAGTPCWIPFGRLGTEETPAPAPPGSTRTTPPLAEGSTATRSGTTPSEGSAVGPSGERRLDVP